MSIGLELESRTRQYVHPQNVPTRDIHILDRVTRRCFVVKASSSLVVRHI